MRIVLAAAVSALVAMATQSAFAGDAAAGGKVFAQCRACHQIGPGAKNLVGPQLNATIGRKAGSIEGFAYSEQHKASNIVWDKDTLSIYLRDPKALIPNNKMVFPGLKTDQQIDDVIAFLLQYDAEGKTK